VVLGKKKNVAVFVTRGGVDSVVVEISRRSWSLSSGEVAVTVFNDETLSLDFCRPVDGPMKRSSTFVAVVDERKKRSPLKYGGVCVVLNILRGYRIHYTRRECAVGNGAEIRGESVEGRSGGVVCSGWKTGSTSGERNQL
jgi:hypothetical protein